MGEDPVWKIPTNEEYDDDKQTRTFKVDDISIVLEVDVSDESNTGESLYLTYYGKNDTWTVPKCGVDLGVYAPHRPEDIKGTAVFEAKNFLFEWSTQKWSYEGSEMYQILDITDKDGKIHKIAEDTLLPNVNKALAN